MSENLLELVKKGESEEIEFKKSTAQLERALKSVCSFLNHRGGRVYFGINKGIIVGQEVSDQTLKTISQKIRQRIKTEVTPEVKVLEMEAKKIIEVIISEGKNKPYYLNRRITTGECASLLKVSNDTSLRELSILRSLGLIDKKGVGRGTYYVIK